MTFHPHPLVRYGAIIPGGLVIAAAGSVVWNAPTAESILTLALTVLLISIPTIRWMLFLSVSVTDSHLLVRGLCWTRRIPRHAIKSLTDGYVFVRWFSASGKLRHSPALALWSNPNPVTFVTEYNEAAVLEIVRWVKTGPGYVTERSSGRHG